MRTITTHIDAYKFDELSDDAKQKAIENLYDINVQDAYFWTDFYPEDFALDPKHFYFDIGRSWSIDVKPASSMEDTALHIVENHGASCESYKIARAFLDQLTTLENIIEDADEETDEGYDQVCDAEEELDELKKDFWHDLGEEILSSLSKQYDYLTSEEAIIEAIEANEYEFTKEGDLL